MAQDIEIKIKAILESAEASKNIDDLKDALEELESIAENVDLSPDELNNLGDAIDNLSGKVEQSEVSLQNFQSGIQTVKASGDLLAGSISAVVGGLATLGIENQYIENLSQGAVGAIAFAGGVSQAGEAIVQLSNNTKIATTAQRAFNVVANLNPYLLGATALLAAGAAIFAIAKSLSKVEDETKNVNIAYTNLIPNLENAKTAYDNLKASIDSVFASEQQNAINAATSGIEKNIQANLSLLGELESSLQTVIERRNIQIAGAAKFNEQFTKEYLESLSLFDLERDKAIAEGRGRADEARAIDFEIQRRQLAQQVAQTTQIVRQGEEAKQKVVDDINAEAAAKRAEERIRRQQENDAELAQIIEATQIQTEALAETSLIIPQIVQQTEEAINNIRGLSATQADAITNTTDLLEEGLISFAVNAEDTFAFLGGLNELFTKDEEQRAERAFKINKAAAIASAIVDTALASQKAFASQIIPADPTSLPRAIAAAVFAGAAGAGRIATIARTQFQGGTGPSATLGGGGFGGGGSAPATPTFSPQQFLGLGQGSVTPAGGPQGDTRVFVVESDITNTQNRVSVIEDRSRIG